MNLMIAMAAAINAATALNDTSAIFNLVKYVFPPLHFQIIYNIYLSRVHVVFGIKNLPAVGGKQVFTSLF